MYQIFPHWWFMVNFPLWCFLIVYAALELILVYTYQFKVVSDFWSEQYKKTNVLDEMDL